MATIVNLDRYRAAKQKLDLSKAGLEKLAQDLGIAWVHTCPLFNVTGLVPKNEPCVWCRACEPKGDKQ